MPALIMSDKFYFKICKLHSCEYWPIIIKKYLRNPLHLKNVNIYDTNLFSKFKLLKAIQKYFKSMERNQ